MAVYSLHHLIHDESRSTIGQTVQFLQQPLFRKELLVGVLRLGHPIGIKEERSIGREGQFLFRIVEAMKQSERNVGGYLKEMRLFLLRKKTGGL